MKFEKFKIVVELPTAEELVAGLELRDVHPGLADAEVVERQRAQDLEDARIALARAITNVERTAADVQAGTQPVPALDAAIRERQALALRIAPAEAAAQAATVDREQAEAKARARVRAEGVRRNRQLELAAEKVAPLLEVLTSLELALETHVGLQIGKPANLPAVTWPMSLRDSNIDWASRHQAVQTVR